MRSIADIRRANLRRLIDDHFDGFSTRLADACGITQVNYISRLLTSGPHRKNIGDRFARKAEQAAGVAPFWLDQERETGPTVQELQIPYGAEESVTPLRPSADIAPVVDWANIGQTIDGPWPPVDVETWMPRPPDTSPRTLYLPIIGNANTNEDGSGYAEGELALVDPHLTPRHGDDVIVQMPRRHADSAPHGRLPGRPFPPRPEPDSPRRQSPTPRGGARARRRHVHPAPPPSRRRVTPHAPPEVCLECGSTAGTRRLTPGSIFIELLLWCMLILPGMIYTVWRLTARRRVCRRCGSARIVPADSPVGHKLLSDLDAEKPPA